MSLAGTAFPGRSPVTAPPAVEVSGLRKVYTRRGGQPVVALDDVSFRVERNEVVGLLGSNGAGKTTTLKCISTLIRPTAGTVRVAGVDALGHPRQVLHRLATVLEGNRNIYWRLTPRENLEFFAALQGISRRACRGEVERLLEIFRLTDKATSPANTLSRGMLQKLGIACALIKQTEVVLLDEPTLGLDVQTTYELRSILKDMARDGSRTILLSSHDMHVVQEVCDRVIIVNRGRVVVDDRVENVLDLFGTRAYEFRLEQQLSEEQQRALRGRFDDIRITAGAAESVIHIEVHDGGALYRVIDALRDNGASIASVERRQPNLEQAFLSIIQEPIVQEPVPA